MGWDRTHDPWISNRLATDCAGGPGLDESSFIDRHQCHMTAKGVIVDEDRNNLEASCYTKFHKSL